MTAAGSKGLPEVGRVAHLWADPRFIDITLHLTSQAVDQSEDSHNEPPGKKVCLGQHAKQSRQQQVVDKAQEELQQGAEHQPAQDPPASIKVGVNKFLLAIKSGYFHKRLLGWDEDPLNRTDADGRQVLVVLVEQGLLEAAYAVLRLMYEEVVPPEMGLLDVAKMCRVSDAWCADVCVQQCLSAMTSLISSRQENSAEVLINAADMLPEGVLVQPEYKRWEKQCKEAVVNIANNYREVRDLLTSLEQLQSFRELPYIVVKAWGGSDDLVVDSEDSVAVALNWWAQGQHGSRCSKRQLEDLGSLLRVWRMTAGFRLYKLCTYAWLGGVLDKLPYINIMAAEGGRWPPTSTPEDWLVARARWGRVSICIDLEVPRDKLVVRPTHDDPVVVAVSQPVYVSGTGVRLELRARKKEGGIKFGVALSSCEYGPPGMEGSLVGAGPGLTCDYNLVCQGETGHKHLTDLCSVIVTKQPSWDAYVLDDDLDKCLTNGMLKLRAVIHEIRVSTA